MTLAASGDVEVEIRGERISLLPERAAYWQRASTLLIADPHWGKAATFRASGIPVPSGTTREAIDRLNQLVTRTQSKTVVFLGDLLHAREGRSHDMFAALAEWRSSNMTVDVQLVRGNHDKRAGDPPSELGFTCVDAPHLADPFVFAHQPTRSEDGYVIAGHVHPGIRIYGAGRSRARLACFVVGADCMVLPAFGDFTGLADVEPDAKDAIFAVAEDRVIHIAAS
jgi:DNA ligase-associated metallophosphoesterase